MSGQGAAALRTIELDERLGGTPVQVAAPHHQQAWPGAGGPGQGAHSLHRHVWGQDVHFPGKERVHIKDLILQPAFDFYQGGHASSFDGEEGVSTGIPESYLLQVSPSLPHTSRCGATASCAARPSRRPSPPPASTPTTASSWLRRLRFGGNRRFPQSMSSISGHCMVREGIYWR